MRIPIINLVQKEQNPKGYKKLQLWYLYRQFFYGFPNFMPWKDICTVSKAAQLKFQELGNKDSLTNKYWTDQPKFDLGRKIFNLDHIYTGDMFRNNVNDLWLKNNNKIDPDELSKLILDNYKMAWILKTEDKRLPR